MSVRSAHALKQLETRREKLRAELAAQKVVMTEAQQAYAALVDKLKRVDQEIADLQAECVGPVVTEHALLRYLERVRGINLDDIRKEILTETAAQQIQALKSCRLPIGDGIVLVVENQVVKTVDVSAAPEQRAAKKKPKTGPKPAALRAMAEDDEAY